MQTSVNEIRKLTHTECAERAEGATREESMTRRHREAQFHASRKNTGRGVRQQSGELCNLRYGEIRNVWGYDPSGAITNEKRVQESLRPVGAIERAVLNGFAEMFGFDGIRGVEIGDGARNFQDAVVGASGKAEASYRVFQKSFAVGGDGALFANQASGHLGVGVSFLFGRETSGLTIASGDDAGADGGRILAGGRSAEFLVFYGGDFDVDVDAVE